MVLWVITYLVMFFSFQLLLPERHRLIRFLRQERGIDALRSASARLRLLQELLESGIVPSDTDWDGIKSFPAPWDQIIWESMRELRNEGAPVIPTLERLHRTLLDQVDFLLESKSKSAQALSQAYMVLAVIPGFSIVLYSFLPGVREASGTFALLALFSTLLAGLACLWILWLGEQARYGNVRVENRRWWISVQATIERIFALISSGRPPDLAWRLAIEELLRTDETLARLWGAQVWDPFPSSDISGASECERLMGIVGLEMRRTLQISLIEGRGCLERLESIHKTSFSELKSRVRTELNLLPNRCLKPLFLFVLPGVILLLTGSLWISFSEAAFQ